MFKTKNFITPITTLIMYFNAPVTIYTNSKSSNLVSVSHKTWDALSPIQFLTDFDWTFSADICAYSSRILNKTVHNNLFYNYKFDFYLTNITSGNTCNTNAYYFFNRIWLEREISETFNIKYTHSIDTRPLLLNYGDETGVLLRLTQVQSAVEFKTHWHGRKILKSFNINIEL